MSAALALACPLCARFARAAGRDRLVVESCPRCCGTGAVLDADVPAPRPRLHEHAVERIEWRVRAMLLGRWVPQSAALARAIARGAQALVDAADPIALVRGLVRDVEQVDAEDVIESVIGALDEHARVIEPAAWARDRHADREREARELDAMARRLRERLVAALPASRRWTKKG